MKKANSLSATRLGTYLSLALGAGALGSHEANAAIVNLDLTGFTGMNGGAAYGGYTYTPNLGNAHSGKIYFSFFNHYGYSGVYSRISPIANAGTAASPVNFSKGSSIGSASFVSSNPYSNYQVFQKGSYYTSPNFGTESYLGFKSQNGDYGWLEATWDGTDFQVLAGAFDDTGAAILAGNTGTVPVPEPTQAASLLLLALGSAGVLATRRRKAAAQAAQAA